jgi:hypothetical protein
MPRAARPVAPVFEPEVAAEAVYWAATHERRELDVGMPTVVAVWGNKFFAGIGDQYLGRTGVVGQQTDALEAPNRPDNLFAPLDADRDHGARGSFSQEARARSAHLWLNVHRSALSALIASSVAVGVAGRMARHRG